MAPSTVRQVNVSERGAGRVFISYRREDTAWPARQLYDVLVAEYGPDRVLKDVPASASPGAEQGQGLRNGLLWTGRHIGEDAVPSQLVRVRASSAYA